MTTDGLVRGWNAQPQMREAARSPQWRALTLNEASRRLALNIKWSARRQGLPLTHIPPRAGIGQGHFFNVLAARGNPSVKWCWKVAKVLDVDIHELFKP
jgi:hypothetical protein